MRIINYNLLGALVFLLLACNVSRKPSENLLAGKNNAICIPNLFPEKGLTDAHTIIVDGRLYAFCGHDKSWDTEDGWIMDRWEIWSTDNLADWKKEGEIHPKDTYIGDLPNCFAGDIISRNGKYYWYFSNRSQSTGVMIADSPTGPFTDALGKPLLAEGIIGKLHPYDPEIYEEDGIYTIVFGAGHYHAATLADDMISLAEKPQPILVLDKEGKDMWTADKSCIFKREGKYYLIWEHKYAMADKLRGPYTFMGESLKGGHCNIFEWEGQYYALLENKDISLFYRGVSLKPLNFNADGTIIVPEDDSDYPANGRAWNFEYSSMGWRAVTGTDVSWDKSGMISGDISGKAVIESSNWLLTDLNKYHELVIKLRNNSKAERAKIFVASFNPGKVFWEKPQINWKGQDSIILDIKPGTSKLQRFKLDLSSLPNRKSQLQRLRIEPAVGAKEGSWEIEQISIQ